MLKILLLHVRYVKCVCWLVCLKISDKNPMVGKLSSENFCLKTKQEIVLFPWRMVVVLEVEYEKSDALRPLLKF